MQSNVYIMTIPDAAGRLSFRMKVCQFANKVEGGINIQKQKDLMPYTMWFKRVRHEENPSQVSSSPQWRKKLVDEMLLFKCFNTIILDINKINMYISNNKFKVARMTNEYFEPTVQLMTEQILADNAVWSGFGLAQEKVYNFMKAKIAEMLQWEQELRQEGVISKDAFYNMVYLNNNDELIGAWTSIELTQYLHKQSNVNLPEFDFLEKYGRELEKSINPKDEIPGLNVYGFLSALKKEYVGTGVTMLFWLDGSHVLHSQGFRVLYCRATSVKTMNNLKKYGGQMIAQLKTSAGFQLWFLKWPLLPIFQTSHLTKIFLERAGL